MVLGGVGLVWLWFVAAAVMSDRGSKLHYYYINDFVTIDGMNDMIVNICIMRRLGIIV